VFGRSNEKQLLRIDPWAEAAVEQNRRWLTAYVLSQTGDPSATDDLVQEVFLVALRKRPDFTPGTNFGGWLRTIARNLCLQYWQRKKRRPVLADGRVQERLEQVAAQAALQNVDPNYTERIHEFLKACLASLSDRARKIMSLRYRENLSSDDVARRLGMQVPAVHTALSRARTALAECIRRKEARA
jgi:RNA polymerase sigma-70 factor (ECF subfamily)